MITRDLLLPSFTADSLALETHWIYSQRQIQELHPKGLPTIAAPRTDYHAGKVAGNFTHYGDQALVLLRSLVKRGGFTPEDWAEDWTAFWESQPISYIDRATAATLANGNQGRPHAPAPISLPARASLRSLRRRPLLQLKRLSPPPAPKTASPMEIPLGSRVLNFSPASPAASRWVKISLVPSH